METSAPPTPPFDALAESYDRTFGASPSGRLFRFRFLERFQARVPPPASILDLGCGTGDDATRLASLGYDVTAIDESPAMIEEARRTAGREGGAAGPSRTPRFVVASAFRSAGELATAGISDSYDAVVSNFGALNCAPLATWSRIVAGLVRPGGALVVSLLGRRPLPEFVRAGRRAWDRRAAGAASVAGRPVRVEYPSCADVRRALSEAFEVRRVEPLGLLVPPPVYASWPRRRASVFATLAALEVVFREFDATCDFGDHFVVEAIRHGRP